VATPVYNSSCVGGRRGWHRSRSYGVVDRNGSRFGGRTPLYLGTGQPAPSSDGSNGSGTPAYLAAPPQMAVTQAAAMEPQPSSVAIVVPRS
jgi:hypothetical protein